MQESILNKIIKEKKKSWVVGEKSKILSARDN